MNDSSVFMDKVNNVQLNGLNENLPETEMSLSSEKISSTSTTEQDKLFSDFVSVPSFEKSKITDNARNPTHLILNEKGIEEKSSFELTTGMCSPDEQFSHYSCNNSAEVGGSSNSFDEKQKSYVEQEKSCNSLTNDKHFSKNIIQVEGETAIENGSSYNDSKNEDEPDNKPQIQSIDGQNVVQIPKDIKPLESDDLSLKKGTSVGSVNTCINSNKEINNIKKEEIFESKGTNLSLGDVCANSSFVNSPITGEILTKTNTENNGLTSGTQNLMTEKNAEQENLKLTVYCNADEDENTEGNTLTESVKTRDLEFTLKVDTDILEQEDTCTETSNKTNLDKITEEIVEDQSNLFKTQIQKRTTFDAIDKYESKHCLHSPSDYSKIDSTELTVDTNNQSESLHISRMEDKDVISSVNVESKDKTDEIKVYLNTEKESDRAGVLVKKEVHYKSRLSKSTLPVIDIGSIVKDQQHIQEETDSDSYQSTDSLCRKNHNEQIKNSSINLGIKECEVNLGNSRISNSMLKMNEASVMNKPNFNRLKRKLEDMLQIAQKEEEKAMKQLKKMKDEKSNMLQDIVKEIQKIKKKFLV